MPKKILTFFNREFNGINEAALLLGGFAFLSQILGLIRDRALASIVGASPTLDVYYAAFRIPDFIYISIASLASVTVLLPFLINKMKEDNNNDKARLFLNNVFSAYMLFMITISIIISIFMPYIAVYIAPGFGESQLASLVTTSRIMLLSPIFIGLSNMIGSVTQLFRNFFIFSLSPIFYNLGILSGIIFLYPIFGVYGLAYGVILGAILHLLVQVPVVVRHGLFPRLTFKIKWREIYNVTKLSIPRTLALSCNSLAFIVLIAMASTLKEGSISLFTFSFNLQSVPVGIIGISYSVAAFPILVRSFSLNDMDNFITHIIGAAKQIIFWSLPIIALIAVLRAQIVRVVLGSNAFSWSDTRLTAAAIALFIVSLVTQSLVLLFVRGYYAAAKTKTPLIVNVFSSVMVIIFAYITLFIFKNYPNTLYSIESILRVKDVPGTIMLALPIAYALGSILNFFLIWIMFKKDFLKGRGTMLYKTFLESSLSAITMGLFAYISLNFFSYIFDLDTFLGIFLQGLISGLIGIGAGVLVLYIFKNQELLDIAKALSHKFSNKNIVAPEQTDL
ncbi:MAG: lipid II flippase MurJ [Candidatus Paceibacterota bacterium]|jgi:putative peptidoglycan lipid II flippase